MSMKIICTDCQKVLPSEWASSTDEHSCPKCGSLKKEMTMKVVENLGLDIKESLKGKVKVKKYNSKDNPRYEFSEGDDLRKKDNKWMKKSRVIDKYKDEYKEKVIDPETGEVIYHNEEPLSDHFGHGSAKFNKDDGKNA